MTKSICTRCLISKNYIYDFTIQEDPTTTTVTESPTAAATTETSHTPAATKGSSTTEHTGIYNTAIH